MSNELPLLEEGFPLSRTPGLLLVLNTPKGRGESITNGRFLRDQCIRESVSDGISLFLI